VDLRLLGPIEATVDGHPVTLGPPKQRALLAMLALERGRSVSVDRLVDGLWGDEPPGSAGKMIHHYVSQLRRVMNGGAEIVTRGRGYELRLTDGELDVARFERLLERGRAREALALWRGDALADLAGEPFAAVEIERLDELRLCATEEAIDAELAAGRHRELVAELDELVAKHPLRERLHAQRILALYRAGRQAEALDAYRDAHEVLIDQSGVAPGPELQRLQRAVLAQDPELELPADERVDASPRPSVGERPRPRGPIVVTAAVVTAAALVAVFVIAGLTGSERPARIDANAVGVVDPGSGRITSQYRVGRGPSSLAVGAGSVWVANSRDGTIARITPGRREVATIDTGGEPAALAFGAGYLWVGDGRGRAVAQVDPGPNKVVQRFDVGNDAYAVAVGYGAVWVSSAVDGTLARIDLREARVTERIAVGTRPTAVAAGAGSIWVASDVGSSVLRVDPRSRTVVARISTGNAPNSVAVGGGAVWVANRVDGTVSRIDPATERVTNTVSVGRDPRAVVAGDGGAWVANAGDGTLVRLDPDDAGIARRVSVGNSPTAVALEHGRLWSAAQPSAATHRGGRLRVMSSPRSAPFDPVQLDEQLVPLVYDGLVSYRRAGGAAGAALVPNLARAVPEPSPDGLTYEFRLRPHLRFSNGRPLRPADVRASVERMMALTEAYDYLPLRDARQCSVTRCDLSSAIHTDARTNTISIRLGRPDAEFLHKLSNVFVVPEGSPVMPADRPFPGTGPYRMKRWDPARGGLLLRNRYFQAPSPDRPGGFADEIAVRLDGDQAQHEAARRGTADVVLGYGVEDPVRERALFGTRLHAESGAQTWYLFLNTQVRPFDDARVRRALNFAVDRGRVAEILGSGATGKPACQLLPPGFEGHTPSCRFSLTPGPAGTWTAPDLAKARRLIAASGTRGTTVEFWSDRPRIGAYFGRLLSRLGYRSRVRNFRDLGEVVQGASSRRPQVGLSGWAADSAGPLNFLTPLISCDGDFNLSRYCDRGLDSAIRDTAAAHGPEALARWERVAALIASKSPLVPLANQTSTSITAPRVGNFQYHPIWGPLLEQMWVR
jgi:YVTN family beta-propeller protein